MSESPAETLRRAATLMRERAGTTMRGPWAATWQTFSDCDDVYIMSPDGQVATIERTPVEGGVTDADHIASWHPDVALAVADHLDAEAAISEGLAAEGAGHGSDPVTVRSLAIARAYLGGEVA